MYFCNIPERHFFSLVHEANKWIDVSSGYPARFFNAGFCGSPLDAVDFQTPLPMLIDQYDGWLEDRVKG